MAIDPARNKITILFLVGELAIPLNSTQIALFFTENKLISYFEVQQLVSELVAAGHLNFSLISGKHFYFITPKGSETVLLFKKQVPLHIQDKIRVYSAQNRVQLKKESQLTAEYKKIAEKEYVVVCQAHENQMVLVELRINVASAKQAGIICSNWKNNAPEICKVIMEHLM